MTNQVAFLFSGHAGSGKDTACNFIMEEFGGSKYALAENVKFLSAAVVRSVYPYIREDEIYNMFYHSKDEPIRIPEYEIGENGRVFSFRAFYRMVNRVLNKICGFDQQYSEYICKLKEHFFMPPSYTKEGEEEENVNTDVMFAFCGPENRPQMVSHKENKLVPVTGRRISQLVGTLARKFINDTIWIDSVIKRVIQNSESFIFITDVRFPNEAQTLQPKLRERGFHVIYFGIKTNKRFKNKCVNSDTTSHPSEIYIDSLPVHKWIDNNGTLQEFRREIFKVTNHYLSQVLLT